MTLSKVPVLLLFALFAGLLSCEDNTESPLLLESDYLIFGHFYGFCHGESCVELFKIENGQLYEDRLDQYPALNDLAPYPQTDFELLPQSDFEMVGDLYSELPQALLQADSQVFGIPDAADQGGVYLEVRRDGVVKVYVIDGNAPAEPAYLSTVVEKILSLTDRLN